MAKVCGFPHTGLPFYMVCAKSSQNLRTSRGIWEVSGFLREPTLGHWFYSKSPSQPCPSALHFLTKCVCLSQVASSTCCSSKSFERQLDVTSTRNSVPRFNPCVIPAIHLGLCAVTAGVLREQSKQSNKKLCPVWGLNSWPADYETGTMPTAPVRPVSRPVFRFGPLSNFKHTVRLN